MKVYGFPEEVKRPEMDYTKFDLKAYQEKEDACSAELKKHLQGLGYTGEHTGKIYRIPHADGYAQYMIADVPSGRRRNNIGAFCLIHLPYLDGWDSPYAAKMTKTEILESVARSERVASLFAAKAEVK